jgi:acyl-CoA synthetase (AMP-forming)/AMP-acid ligase II
MFCLYHLASGNLVVLYPPMFSAAELVEVINRNDISYVFLVPTVLRWLLAQPSSPGPLLPGVRALLTSAAPIAAAEKLAVRERICPDFYEYYATSAAGTLAVLRPQDMEHHADSVGRPLACIDVGIADDAGLEAPPGTAGRVRCRGPGVSRNLLVSGGSGEESERFEDGWCYTGDLGWQDGEGYLHISGRADEVIIRGGVNIQPEDIERVLCRHPAVAEAAVVGRTSPELGQDVVAFVQAKGPLTIPELMAHCRSSLPGHMIPARIELVDSLPRNAAGKVRRRELP